MSPLPGHVMSLLLLLTACGGGDVGIVVAPTDHDVDDDGFLDDVDCNDSDPDVNPEAEEVPDDGIDQDCDGVDSLTEYGHRDDTETTTLVADFLIGNLIRVQAPLEVSHLGFSCREPQGEAVVGLYTSDGGRPAELIAATPAAVIVDGVNEVALEEPVVLEAGDFWLQLVVSETLPIGNGPEELVVYKDHPWGEPLPDPYGFGTDYEGPRISLFMAGELP